MKLTIMRMKLQDVLENLKNLPKEIHMQFLKSISGRRNLFVMILMVGAVVLLGGCSEPEPPVPCPETNCPDVSCPDPVSYEELWATSGHADAKAEAFTHWDEDDPQEIPIDCAKCHSRPGFIDFLGVDGTEAGIVDKPAITGTTISCFVCHNEEASELSRVTFPSGATISGLGPEARCVQCHQGRQSTVSVDEAIEGQDEDTVSEGLEFLNVHYFAAGATLFGTEAKGAYEYEDNTYSGRFLRAEDLFTCVRCHDQHSLEINIEFCKDCHTSIEEELTDIRVDSTDYDGDGNVEEGIVYEIETILESLYVAIQLYAHEAAGIPIVYEAHTYPYFFIDSNGNGEVDPGTGDEDGDGEIDSGEADYDNKYNAWTPRLLRAAYNYQFVSKDPGAFAHNADYIIQILYDSLSDIGGDMNGMQRPDSNGN